MHAFKTSEENTASEDSPGYINAKKYIEIDADILGDTFYFSEAYMGNYFLRVVL